MQAHRQVHTGGWLQLVRSISCWCQSTARKEKEESAARTERSTNQKGGTEWLCSEFVKFNFAGEAARERRDEGGTARGRELQRSTMADADERRTTRQRGAVR